MLPRVTGTESGCRGSPEVIAERERKRRPTGTVPGVTRSCAKSARTRHRGKAAAREGQSRAEGQRPLRAPTQAGRVTMTPPWSLSRHARAVGHGLGESAARGPGSGRTVMGTRAGPEELNRGRARAPGPAGWPAAAASSTQAMAPLVRRHRDHRPDTALAGTQLRAKASRSSLNCSANLGIIDRPCWAPG